MIIQVCFNHGDKRYCSGDKLAGKVEIVTDTSKKLRQITVEFKGFTYCSWTELQKNKYGVIIEEHFEHLTTHFKESDTLAEIEGDNFIDLDPGEHFYNFKFELPKDLPPSVAGLYGHTTYLVFVKINLAGQQKQSKEASFTIIGHLDLNNVLGAKAPFLINISEGVGLVCWLCVGLVRAAISVNRHGFVIGEIVPFSIQVHNNSCRRLLSIKVQLIQYLKYHASQPHENVKMEERVITDTDFKGIRAKSSRTIDASFYVPLVPPTNSDSAIEISYKFSLILKFRRWFPILQRSKCVYIGTEPLQRSSLEVVKSFLGSRVTFATLNI